MNITLKGAKSMRPWGLGEGMSGACSARYCMEVYLVESLSPLMTFATTSSLHLSTAPRMGYSHSFSESRNVCFKDIASDCAGCFDSAANYVCLASKVVTVSESGNMMVAVTRGSRRVRVSDGGSGFSLFSGNAVWVAPINSAARFLRV